MPGVPGTLPIIYSPLKIGCTEGSVVLDSEATGEFWYKVIAKALPLPPVSLPTIDCRLGEILIEFFKMKICLIVFRKYKSTSNPSKEYVE